MFGRVLPAAAALAVAAAVSSSARAAEVIGVLAVADPPGPPTELVEATAQFRAVLAERFPGVLDAIGLRARMVGQVPTSSLSEIDVAFAGAVATYQAGDYEGAIRTLRGAIEELEKLPDSPEAFAQWTRVMIRLARAEQTVGQRAAFQATLERLVRAAPQAKVDLTQYPPSFAAEVDRVRARLAALPKRSLKITAAQKGVAVYVNGRHVGTAPLTVELFPGRYRISGALQNLRVPGLTADLTEANESIHLDFALANALRPDAGPGLALPRADRTRETVAAAGWLGLDRVAAVTLLVENDVTYLQGTMFDVRRGSMTREARLRLSGGSPPQGGLTALAAFLMTGTPSSLVAAMVTAEPKRPAPEPASAAKFDLKAAPPRAEVPIASRPDDPWSRLPRWAPAAGAGLTVVLGTVAAVSAAKASSDYSRANGMVSGGSLRFGASPGQYNDYVSSGNSARNLAVGAGVAAGVSLAATSALAYVSYRRTGEVWPFRF
ncbi:MAG TPA: PEGA domain-containing protein [Anaeromyxobacter sp.]